MYKVDKMYQEVKHGNENIKPRINEDFLGY